MNSYDPYQALANAIIVTAAEDYKLLYEQSLVNPNNRSVRMKRTHLEKFFYSDLYQMLSDLDADYLLKRIREEVNNKLKERYPYGR